MGRCNLPRSFPVSRRCGPTCPPAASTAERGPAAIWSSSSSPLQKFLPICRPLFQPHDPTPKLHFRCHRLKSHFPSGAFQTALCLGSHRTCTSHFWTRHTHSQAASPPGACSPKQLICPLPVRLPCSLEGLALSRKSTNIWRTQPT